MDNSFVRCSCEHEDHFGRNDEAPSKHAYLEVPAGDRHARYVGLVCNACADTCMANYMIDTEDDRHNDALHAESAKWMRGHP